MKINLKDIIDLDYFITCDNKLDSKENIKAREFKDREIYTQCQKHCKTNRQILFSWLKFRRNENEISLLPGTVYSFIYTCVVYIMFISGFIMGISTVYSFLAYHGTRPVNVSSFAALFIVLQVVFILLTLMFLVKRVLRKNRNDTDSIVRIIVSFLFFNVVPKIIKKTRVLFFKQNKEDLDYCISFMRMKKKEYKALFFWPLFILTSVFALSFSTGVLSGIFFKIVVSDMAFGWQSTLITSSSSIHDLVLFTALPWSWFIPEPIAFPNLEQIEGSRIILKYGIYALTTNDLVSWWPFLCLSILFYAVIPRVFFIIFASFFQQQTLKKINFTNPKFRQLIIRMKSPVVDVDTQEISMDQEIKKDFRKKALKTDSFESRHNINTGKASLLVSKKVYSDKKIDQLVHGLEKLLLFNINTVIGINFNFDDDAKAVAQIQDSDSRQVILVQEVWQPPIRELLYYFTKIKTIISNEMPLYILLTKDAAKDNLGVDKKDINFKVWEKKVFQLEDPGISVIGFR